jgi:regulator of protease activity HflC (stomatin/prohibitin superfamily)
MDRFTKGGIIFGVVLVVLITLFCMCSTTVKPGYVGVVYSANGGLEDVALGQGFHMIMPWKSVTSYPISTETVYLSKSAKEGDKDDESVLTGSSDGKQINMDVSFTYHFDGARVKNVYTKFRGQSAEIIADTYIRRAVKNNLNNTSTQYGVFDIYGIKRSEVAANTFKAMAQELEPDGILIESFNITEVRPDEQTSAAIQQRVNAQQSFEQSKIAAEQAIVVANNEAEKVLIAAKMQKEKAEIEAQQTIITATANTNVVRMAADAENYANKTKLQTLTPELIQYLIASKWNGQLPTVSNGGNGQILNVGDFLKK